jgi:hypothetical protein
MSNKRRILLVSLLIAILGVISWLILRQHDPEPVYNGKPLTYWLDSLINRTSHPSQVEAEKAVQKIGTNAIPTLLRLLRTRDSKFKLNLIQLTHKQHLVNLKWNTALFQHIQAETGFRCLGPNGKSALPDLIEIYNKRPPGQYNDAPWVIPSIFAAMGPAAADAVPQLAQDTADADRSIRSRAVLVLGQIHARPDLAVPALTRSLRDSDSHLQEEAAFSLAAFGTNAQFAITGLITALSDPYPNVRTAAAYALKQIDPAAAANAGVK